MNSEKDNLQIIQYLLGTLPDEETEHFDELSFTDDDFSERLKAVENDLIDQYLNHELKEDTLKSFESHYLASPLRREKVKFAAALQFFGEQNTKAVSEEKTGFLYFINNLFGNNKIQLGFAAAALLFLVLGGLWLLTNPAKETEIGRQKTPAPIETPPKNESINTQNQIPSAVDSSENITPTPKTENKNTAPSPKMTVQTPLPTATPLESKPIIASLVLTPPLRGENKVQTILVTGKTTTVSIQLQLEADDYKTYSVSLLDPSNKSILQSGKIKAKGIEGKRYLSLNFPARLLADGFYSLNVSGIGETGSAEIFSNYQFRAVLK